MIKLTPTRHQQSVSNAMLSLAPLPPCDGAEARRKTARAELLAALCLWLALSAPVMERAAVAALPTVPEQAKAPCANQHRATTPEFLAFDAPDAAKPAASPSSIRQRPTQPQSAANQQTASLTLATGASREVRGALEPETRRAKANDGGDNPRPVRAMFPWFALNRAAEAQAAEAPTTVALSTSPLPPITRRSDYDLSLTAAPPVPRSDVSISALPFIWKDGRAALPLTRLAAGDAPPASGALPQPAKGEAPANVPGMNKDSLVINVSALKLPPASRPLPPSLQSKAVSAETRYITSLPRLAQAGTVGGDTKAPAAGAANEIEVTASTFVVLIAPDDLQTVAVADPAIADVVVINSRAVLVNGKAAGATSLVIVDKKIRQYHVRVVPASGESAADVTSAVANAINLPNVQVRAVRGAIVLDGMVANAEEKRMAAEIAGLYAPKVVDLLQLRTAPPPAVEPLAVQIKNAIGNDAVQVRVLGDSVLLEGLVTGAPQQEAAVAVATALAKDLKVVNLIRIPAPPAPPAPTLLTVEDVNNTLKPLQSTAPAPTDDTGLIPVTPAPVSRITARQVRDQIILEGVAATAADIAQATAVATRTGLNVVNRIELVQPAATVPAELQQLNSIAMIINRAIPGAKVVVGGGTNRLILTGTVPSTNAAVIAEQIARGYNKQVDNMMTTPRPQQVDVDITVLEINRNDVKNLGATYTQLLDSVTANPTGFVIGQTGGGGGAFQFRSPFQASLRAEIANGNARLLSNPHTTVLSGRTATFKVGGEVPIPGVTTLSGNGNATTSIIFKPFGILIDVTPVASDDGAITLQVRSEVSQPDFTIGVAPPGGGGVVPGFSQRQAQTEVTVEPGGTLALAGLIQNNSRQLLRKLPVLGDIPVLGALFSSKRYQKDETELMIFITPKLQENKLKPGIQAPARSTSVGESTSAQVIMGVQGIPSFTTANSTNNFAVAPSGGSAGQ